MRLPKDLRALGYGLVLTFAAHATAIAALPAQVDGVPMPSLAPMLERTQPAVVNVSSRSRVQVRSPFFNDPFFREFFGDPEPQERVESSLGSGVIVDAAKGLILTNNHVIEQADEISVTLNDGRTLPAEIVGTDPDTDVAVIRVKADRLVALPLANSDALRTGDFVVAVGNPFGLGQTVTSGIVSALGRSGLRGLGYQNFIQTDASINPGNSGGALLNLRGELVGVNTAIFSPSGGNVGIGFAIPANLARNVMNQLLAFGEVQRGSLGVQAQDLDERLARALNLGAVTRGAVVSQVVPNTPAAKAGLREGDVITAIAGKNVTSANDVSNIEGLLPLGVRHSMTILRDGKPQTLPFTLAAFTASAIDASSFEQRLSGARIADLPTGARNRGAQGVQIVEVRAGSIAARYGLLKGDLIAGVNRYRVDNIAQFKQIMAAANGRSVTLTIYRNRRSYTLTL
jgi:serine protease DegQ